MGIRISRSEARELQRRFGIEDGSLVLPKPLRATGATPDTFSVHLVLPEGTVIASGVVHGRAIPWKVPHLNRNGRVNTTSKRGVGYKRMLDWQDWVRSHGKGPPYAGKVLLNARFYLKTLGQPGREPDRTNLLKAFEDGLEWKNGMGFIVNDRMVKDGRTEVLECEREVERVEFEIIAMGA